MPVLADYILTTLRAIDVSWLDLVDVLVVAFIVYQVLQLVRGTQVVQMALGGFLLAVLYWASKAFDLQTVNWLIRTFVPYVAFGLIVVFQSEIRRMLAHLGTGPLRGLSSPRRAHPAVDEVVLAATRLSAQRTGALIVFERNMGLRSYIDTGIALDALVTYDLLVNIFNPGTPLHDGAVIIQSNRIAAAACFLPLTVNPELSRTLGSRHRAAIGVTEDTDAATIVVSEETGAISLVEGGRIRSGLDGGTLKAGLRGLLEPESARQTEVAAPENVTARP